MLASTLLCSHRTNTAGRLLAQITALQSQFVTRHNVCNKLSITQSNCKSLATCGRNMNRQFYKRTWLPKHHIVTASNFNARAKGALKDISRYKTQRSFSTSSWRNFPRGTMFMDIMKEEEQRRLQAEEEEEEEGEDEEQDSKMEENVAKEEEESQDTVRPHIPVMLKEVLTFLEPKENQVFLDMTFGAGGHTEAILQQCDKCQVIALDRDPLAYELATNMAEKYGKERLLPLLGRFSNLSALLLKENIAPGSIDGTLIDAGCSSMQFDTAERGFALSKDGPLDMRMDGKSAYERTISSNAENRIANQPTAADVVNSLDVLTLANILHTYGEEPKAKQIAKTIVQYREKCQPIQTTKELATVVSYAFTHREADKSRDGLGRHAHVATKTFLALRIFVNNELNELNVGLKTVETFMKAGGRLAVLSFHSMEDRIVKRVMQGRDVTERSKTFHQLKRAASSKDLPIEDDIKTVASQWDMCKDLQRASQEEIDCNPRSRSAKLRTAVKL